MDMYVYIVFSTCDLDESYAEHIEGIFYDEKTAKEAVDILNKQEESDDCAPWYEYSYYGKKVFGTVEDFMKERDY